MMNERIQKLLKESGIDQNWNNEDFMVSKKEMEYFAELIVQECANWMSDGNIPDGGYEARRMLEHFGVEE
jgi:hypothetical protein